MKKICWRGAFAFAAVVAAQMAVAGSDGVWRTPIEFDARGRIASLKDETGRELVSERVEMVRLVGSDGTARTVQSFRREGSGLRWTFADGACVSLALKPFDGGWTFTVTEAPTCGVSALTFAAVKPVCDKWVGNRANLFSDERSGVALRAYDFVTDMAATRDGGLSVTVRCPTNSWTGLRAGLCAGTRGILRDQLKAMTLEAGVPRTLTGGAWSLDAPENRRSYLFADLGAAAVDDWISLAKRSGISIIHLHMWWNNLGSYPPSKAFFPGGLEQMKETVAKIHAAGLYAGMHTLTGSIDPVLDDWVRDESLNQYLYSQRTYTLAKPIGADDDVLYVNEPPQERHDLVFSYHSVGNTLRIGGELIDYSGVKREPPYGFTGLRRGAFGTRKAAHAAGVKCDYLRQRYLAFYPIANSPLGTMLADKIAEVYNTCDINQIYFDGAEEPKDRYQVDQMRKRIFERLDQSRHPVIDESSTGNPHYWWFHSRVGAADHPRWGAKRFHDEHVKATLAESRDANLMAPMLGWWAPRKWTDAVSRGHFPDEIEYYAAKVVGLDSAMAIQGVDVTKGPLPEGQLRMMTYLGWYERPKVAGAFTAAARQTLAVPGDEYRLRQDADGVWRLTKADCSYHRVADAPSSAWTLKRERAGKAAVRVEALLGASDDWDSADTIFAANDLADVRTKTADGVTVSLAPRKDPAHGDTLAVVAANAKGTAKGAWTSVLREFKFPYRDLKGRLALGLWVKGDGSGATLNVQIQNAREFMYAFNEHYLKLDFTGWRYVTFLCRERDGYEWVNHVWPYSAYYGVWGNDLVPERIQFAGVWLNDVPAGGKASVEISDIRLLAETRPQLRGGVLTVNGRSLPLPFDLEAGDYAELEDDVWTRYDRFGEPLARAKSASAAELAVGENRLSFMPPRAEVTVFALGARQPAFANPLTDEMRRGMDVEFCETAVFAPAKGFMTLPDVRIRPNEKAKIFVACRGAKEPVTVDFENELGERMSIVAPGETPAVGGTWKMSVRGVSEAKIDVEKRYVL